jgi:hypothetical protein
VHYFDMPFQPLALLGLHDLLLEDLRIEPEQSLERQPVACNPLQGQKTFDHLLHAFLIPLKLRVVFLVYYNYFYSMNPLAFVKT